MHDRSCPACEMPISDAAFATGACPCCGVALGDAPTHFEPLLVEAAASPVTPVDPVMTRGRACWAIPATAVAFACGVVAGYFLFGRTQAPTLPTPAAEVAAVVPSASVSPVPSASGSAQPASAQNWAPTTIVVPTRMPEAVAVITPPAAKPIRIDPFDAATRKLDAPTGSAEVVPLDGDDRLTLTGRVKVLTLNAVNGGARLDASGLETEEIVLAGDVNGHCRLKLNARGGTVTIRRAVVGSCILTVAATGGAVTLAEGGRIGGGTAVMLMAKTVDARGTIDEGARVDVTLTGGGGLTVAAMDGGATVAYRRADKTDPPPTVATGDLRGSSRVIESK